jgi:hypothetical protein
MPIAVVPGGSISLFRGGVEMTERTQRRGSRRIVWAAAAIACLASGDGLADEHLRAQADTAPGSQLVAEMTNVTGTITRVGDDLPGQRHAIGIVSPEQRVYLIAQDEIGQDFENLVGRTVTVSAFVKHDIDGWPYLSVEWYRVLKG